MKIHQLLPGFGSGDAISNYALQLQKIMRGWGWESDIYCPLRHVGPTEQRLVRDCGLLAPSTGRDAVIYHYSISSELTEIYKNRKGTRILFYHNITPPEYFETVHPGKAEALKRGREDLGTLTACTDLAAGASRFNQAELEEAGFRKTAVLPYMLDRSKLSAGPDPAVLKRYRDGAANILFVGRVAPNKRVEDLIKVFYYFRNSRPGRSRLIVAGSLMGLDRYVHHLNAVIRLLELPDVVFTNHVIGPQLHALYRASDVFLCMSEHEGFCMPLLEAMYFRLPVVGFAAAAVPETMGGAGVAVREKNFPAIAELLGSLCDNGRLREAVIKKQSARIRSFSPEEVARRLADVLRPWSSREGRERDA